MVIDSVIFDLGRVVVDVDPLLTIEALKKNCPTSQLSKVEELFANEAVLLFELGKISKEEFLLQFKKSLLLSSDIDVIADAWDAMICGISLESISLLKNLKKRFPIYALSNTNSSHLQVINTYLTHHHSIPDFKEVFNKVYYSFELGLSKPDRKIFEHVLADSKLRAESTLFIDDNLQNILTAKELKFQTIHLSEQAKLAEMLKQIGVLENSAE
jgi:putative hydrolase of the HAD superfamily